MMDPVKPPSAPDKAATAARVKHPTTWCQNRPSENSRLLSCELIHVV
jgi:hypothetical protein